MTRTMLITGASSGALLLSSFDHVVGVSRRGPDIEVDLSERYTVGKIRDGLIKRYKTAGVDAVILNAGILDLNETDEVCEKIYQLNFLFNEFFLRTCTDVMDAGGCIILNASISGVTGDPDIPFYSAMKAALINLCKSYAKKLAPK